MPPELENLNIDISTSGIISSLIFGIIGMWMFREGKREAKMPIMLIAIALMMYPYLTTGPLADWGVGVVLCGLAYYFW